MALCFSFPVRNHTDANCIYDRLKTILLCTRLKIQRFSTYICLPCFILFFSLLLKELLSSAADIYQTSLDLFNLGSQ